MTGLSAPATNVGCPIQAPFLGLSGIRSTVGLGFALDGINRKAPVTPAIDFGWRPKCKRGSKGAL
jgi:hypothetical protein